MDKKIALLLALFLLLILSGCADSTEASAGKIMPPPLKDNPIGGTWSVLSDLGQDADTKDGVPSWKGTRFQFSEDAAAFGGQIWDNLSFKIKRVNAEHYLMTKYISVSDFLAPDTKAVDVITIYASSNYLGEFLRIDASNMIFFVQNNSLLLNKISDTAEDIGDAAGGNGHPLASERSESASGVLLGLKTSTDKGYSYRTLWISADQHELRPVLVADQIFFPRMSGFWEFTIQEVPEGGEVWNIMTARNISASARYKELLEEMGEQICAEPAVKSLDYIGNDYVTMQKVVDGFSELQVFPVDKLSSPTKIKIADLLGENGEIAYRSARTQAVEALRNQGFYVLEGDDAGENFGLVRENGHWNLIGRINYQDGEKTAQTDFKLNIIPPYNLIFYDTLAVNWHTIRDRVPDATDAFTAPDKSIALVKTKNKLTVYAISGEQLSQNPLGEIEMRDGETVIMAEWATIAYVDSWEQAFVSYGAQVLANRR